MHHPRLLTRSLVTRGALLAGLGAAALLAAAPAQAQPKTTIKVAPAPPAAPPKSAEILLLEAEAQGMEAKGDWRGALARWQQIFTATTDPKAADHLANVYEHLDELFLADAMLNLALQQPATPEPDRAALQQRRDALAPRLKAHTDAAKLLSSGDPTALAAWTVIYEQHPGATSLAAIAQAQRQQGLLPEAIASLTKLLDTHPTTVEAEKIASDRLAEAQVLLYAQQVAPPAEAPPEEVVSLENDVRLIPLPEDAPPYDSGWTPTKITGFSLLGVGIAGALTGIGLDIYTQDKINKYTDAIAANESPAMIADRADEITTLQDTVIFTYLGSFASVGVGAVLLFIAYAEGPPPTPSAPPEDKSAGLQLDVGLGSVQVTLPF